MSIAALSGCPFWLLFSFSCPPLLSEGQPPFPSSRLLLLPSRFVLEVFCPYHGKVSSEATVASTGLPFPFPLPRALKALNASAAGASVMTWSSSMLSVLVVGALMGGGKCTQGPDTNGWVDAKAMFGAKSHRHQLYSEVTWTRIGVFLGRRLVLRAKQLTPRGQTPRPLLLQCRWLSQFDRRAIDKQARTAHLARESESRHCACQHMWGLGGIGNKDDRGRDKDK